MAKVMRVTSVAWDLMTERKYGGKAGDMTIEWALIGNCERFTDGKRHWVRLVWVTAHNGLAGNEEAELLVKRREKKEGLWEEWLVECEGIVKYIHCRNRTGTYMRRHKLGEGEDQACIPGMREVPGTGTHVTLVCILPAKKRDEGGEVGASG
ncbi:hypothetical protein EV426DRAFT_699392 [Tirmania nivea]|nr:hypothetical protein EV426DRAFT_699392 [Tirmania nivea]